MFLLISITDFRDVPETSLFLSTLQHGVLSLADLSQPLGPAFISGLRCPCRQKVLCCSFLHLYIAISPHSTKMCCSITQKCLENKFKKLIWEKISVEKNKDGRNEMKLRMMMLYEVRTAGSASLLGSSQTCFLSFQAAHKRRKQRVHNP